MRSPAPTSRRKFSSGSPPTAPQPYTHYELKRTRNRWRFFDELHGPVYKTTYVRREYAVGSDQGGTLQPIQEHSWDVTWSVPDPRGVQNTLFTLNPYSSLHELQTYFTFPPDIGISGVVSSKKSYDSPDKFVGGSPHEKIFQDQDTIVALYDIPPDSRFPHINGFFSKDLAEVSEDPSGWIFARGGDALIACRPLQPYTWKPIEDGGRRLFSPYLKNGIVVQVAARSEFADMEAFRRAILALPLEFSLEPTPSIRFHSLRGRTLEFTYGQVPRRDGAAPRLRTLAAFWRTIPGSARGFRNLDPEIRHPAPHSRFPAPHGQRHAMKLPHQNHPWGSQSWGAFGPTRFSATPPVRRTGGKTGTSTGFLTKNQYFTGGNGYSVPGFSRRSAGVLRFAGKPSNGRVRSSVGLH